LHYTQLKIDQHNIIIITETPSLITRIIDISKHFQYENNNLKINNQLPRIKNKLKTCPDINTIPSVTNVPQMTDFHTPTTFLKTGEIIHINEIKTKNIDVEL